MSDIVYHYCSVDTFYNIIKNASIWLSDITKSNDKKEFSWIQNKVHNELREQIILLQHDSKVIELWDKVMNAISYNPTKLYATCFSSSADCLSQWRGYAKDGTGLSIGFSKKYSIS